jgi:cell division septum initiation protein DivIVA
MTDVESRLVSYEAELEHLRTENEQLRRSAQAFGELAERLNRALLIASSLQPTIAEFKGCSARL